MPLIADSRKKLLLNKLSNLFSLTQIKLKTAALKRSAYIYENM